MSRTAAELEAEVVRLYYAEHWKVGTIATQLALHPDVVRRVLGISKPSTAHRSPRPRLVEPYREFIVETLARYPTLRCYGLVTSFLVISRGL